MTNAEKVLKHVLDKGGEITFSEFTSKDAEPFIKLRAVVFTEKYDDSLDQFDNENDPDNWNWNKFCNKIHTAIGADYCSWIGWSKDMKGIIAAYTKEGHEVKLKYFEDYPKNWGDLLKHIKNDKNKLSIKYLI